MSTSFSFSRYRRPIVVSLVLLVALALFPVIDLLILSSQVQKANFAKPSGEDSDTWLLVASDSRENAPHEILQKNDIQEYGERADLIFLARRAGDKLIVAALPRDIDVVYQNNPRNRLTLMLTFGPTRLNAAVCNDLGIPAGHYLQLDMNGFVNLTDAVGGLEVELAHPMRDRDTKLNLKEGKQTLSGKQALAFVRARSYQELIDDKWQDVAPGKGANMRIEHSKMAIQQIKRKLRTSKNPFVWRKAIWSVGKDAKIDEYSSWRDLLTLVRGEIVSQTIDTEIVSADSLHRRLTPKGIKQLEELGFKKPCRLPYGETTTDPNVAG